VAPIKIKQNATGEKDHFQLKIIKQRISQERY